MSAKSKSTKKVNLGFKPDYWNGMTSPTPEKDAKGKKEKKKEAPTVYPSFTIRDHPEIAKALKLGEKVECRVTLNPIRMEAAAARNSEYGGGLKKRAEMEVEVHEIHIEHEEKGGDEDKTASDAMDEAFGKEGGEPEEEE